MIEPNEAHLNIAREILYRIATYDKRMRADEMTAHAWAVQVAISNLGLQDCLAGVDLYYRDHGTSPRTPLPADILGPARGVRNDRRVDVEPDKVPANPEHVMWAKAHMGLILANRQRRKPRSEDPEFHCPHCMGPWPAGHPLAPAALPAAAARSFAEPLHPTDDESPFL